MELSKKVKYGIKVLNTKLFNTKAPYFVSFIFTNQCNLRCSYCSIPYRKQNEMDTKQILSMIDEFKEMGTIKISFNGGEPLLRPDAEEILRHTKEKGIMTNLITNGLLVKSKLNVLRHVDYLLISSNKEIKNELFMESIMFAVDNGIKVWIVSIIVKGTVGQIEELVGISDSLGVGLLFQPLETAHSTTALNESLVPTKQEYEECIKKIIELKKKGKNIVNSYPYLDFLLKGDFRPKKCLVGKTMCVVDVDGMIYPCVPAIGKMKGISGLENGFKSAFNSLPAFRCSGCSYSCYHEPNFLFDLNIKSIFNVSGM